MKRLLQKVVICMEKENFQIPAYREEGVLYVTGQAELASELANKGQPVLGILNENNRDASFGKTRFLAEAPEALLLAEVPEALFLAEEPKTLPLAQTLSLTGTPVVLSLPQVCKALSLPEKATDYLERVYRRYVGEPWEILETERCTLRESTEEDVEAFYRIYQEPSVTRYMEPLFADKEEEKNYIRQYRENMYEFYGFGIWSVLLKETGELIGRAGLDMRAGFETPELGFVVGVPWQGRGLAEEICGAILAYAEKELGITRVQAMVEPANTVSLRLLKKLGFQKSGEYDEGGKHYFLLLYGG